MKIGPVLALLPIGLILVACSSTEPAETMLQEDDPDAMQPGLTPSNTEAGNQFIGTGEPYLLARLISTDISTWLNSSNQAIFSGTGLTADANNCLLGFEPELGLPVTSFDCVSPVPNSNGTAQLTAGAVASSDYCQAALIALEAQNCAISNAVVTLNAEWIVIESNGAVPARPQLLPASTISYSNGTLQIDTPAQEGFVAVLCQYNLSENFNFEADPTVQCSQRVTELIDRLQNN